MRLFTRLEIVETQLYNRGTSGLPAKRMTQRMIVILIFMILPPIQCCDPKRLKTFYTLSPKLASTVMIQCYEDREGDNDLGNEW